MIKWRAGIWGPDLISFGSGLSTIQFLIAYSKPCSQAFRQSTFDWFCCKSGLGMRHGQVAWEWGMDNWMVGSPGSNTRDGKFILVPKVYVGTKEPTKKKKIVHFLFQPTYVSTSERESTFVFKLCHRCNVASMYALTCCNRNWLCNLCCYNLVI